MTDTLAPTVDLDVNTPAAEFAVRLPLDELHHDPDNARLDHGQDAKDLAASIADVGLLAPLRVVTNDEGTYTVIAGNRRLNALRHLAGAGKLPADIAAHGVPCIIETGDAERVAVIAAADNLLRRDLGPVEEARAYRRCIAAGMNAGKIGKQFGVATNVVRGRLALLSLPDWFLAAIDDPKLPDLNVSIAQDIALACADHHDLIDGLKASVKDRSLYRYQLQQTIAKAKSRDAARKMASGLRKRGCPVVDAAPANDSDLRYVEQFLDIDKVPADLPAGAVVYVDPRGSGAVAILYAPAPDGGDTGDTLTGSDPTTPTLGDYAAEQKARDKQRRDGSKRRTAYLASLVQGKQPPAGALIEQAAWIVVAGLNSADAKTACRLLDIEPIIAGSDWRPDDTTKRYDLALLDQLANGGTTVHSRVLAAALYAPDATITDWTSRRRALVNAVLERNGYEPADGEKWTPAGETFADTMRAYNTRNDEGDDDEDGPGIIDVAGPDTYDGDLDPDTTPVTSYDPDDEDVPA